MRVRLLTSVQARNLVPDDRKIEDLTKLLKHRPQVFLLHVFWDLSHEQLDRIRVLQGMAVKISFERFSRSQVSDAFLRILFHFHGGATSLDF